MKTARKTRALLPAAALVLAALATSAGCANEDLPGEPEVKIVTLRADITTMTMPDGKAVTVWGFAEEVDGPMTGLVTVPGPAISVEATTARLTIRLRNNLTEARTGWPGGVPVSIVIPALEAKLSPVRWGAAPFPEYEGRVRSLTTETPPDGVSIVEYTWDRLRPGSYLYQSGTHMQVQVQMGLFGAVIKDFGRNVAPDGTPSDVEVLFVYHELDADLHEAVASNNYGPGKAMTSTVDYNPEYYLINGACAGAESPTYHFANPGATTLVHFLNAGLEMHSPILYGLDMKVIGEDGYAYPFPRLHSSLPLPAGKSKDVLVVTPASGGYALYDGAMGMTNDGMTEGGMFAYVQSP